MKKSILTMFFLLFATSAFCQYGNVISYSPYIDVTLTDTETDTIYVLFPDIWNNWFVSDTLPTKYYDSSTKSRPQLFSINGDVYYHIMPVESTGMDDTESDSLAAYFKPLAWNPKNESYSIIDADSAFIIFDSQDSYVSLSAISWLDWNDGGTYGSLLTGYIFPSGLAIFIKQANSTSGESVISNWFCISRQWR